MDLQTALRLNHLQLGSSVDSVLVGASLYGREYFWGGLILVLLVFGDRHTRVVGLGLAALMIVGFVAGDVAKVLIIRDRPPSHCPLLSEGCGLNGYNPILVRILPLDTDSSFPSGHALIVSIGAAYSLVAFRKKWVAVLLVVEAAIVCISRVYVGVHFPTDILGGFALGACISLGGYLIGRRYFSSPLQRAADVVTKALREGPLAI